MSNDQKTSSLEASERWERWLKVSIGLLRFEQQMMPLVQQLGRLDIRLIEADDWWAPRFASGTLTSEENSELHGHITLSYLWLLGAYEFIRTLCQRVRSDDPMTPPDVRAKVQHTRNLFERVRIPLAKMEKSRRFGREDHATAYPGMHKSMGVAWKVNDVTWVSRRQLSDSLLEVLEFRRAEFLRWRALNRDLDSK